MLGGSEFFKRLIGIDTFMSAMFSSRLDHLGWGFNTASETSSDHNRPLEEREIELKRITTDRLTQSSRQATRRC
jgi:hypothetical protein